MAEIKLWILKLKRILSYRPYDDVYNVFVTFAYLQLVGDKKTIIHYFIVRVWNIFYVH